MLKPLLTLALALAFSSSAQAPAALAQAGSPAAAKQPGRIVLVLPFDNRSGNPSLAWIGDSFPDTLNQRLASAGYQPVTQDDRQYALDHLGLPPDFRPTRATTIRIAQNLDADYVIVGSYNVQSTPGQQNVAGSEKIQVQAQVLEVNKLHLSAPVQDAADLPRLLDAENAVAWKVARQIDPHFAVAEQTFLSASANVPLPAFENYVRGTAASNSTERVKRLEAAVKDAPTYAAAALALGKELYKDRDFDRAAAALARVPQTSRLSLEAGFYLGLARFNDAKYAEAEAAFSSVASRLPLPEVVNDVGVAAARQGKDAIPVFQRASNADPNDPDYRYNLAVAHYKHNDSSAALHELDQVLKLRPNDTEAQQLRKLAAEPAGYAHATGNGFEPTERLRRTYSEVSFRQAAAQLDQIRAMRLATLPPAQQAAEYIQQGHDYLAQGLLPEAEQEFHEALSADSRSAAAHTGLAAVREQSGNIPEAQSEARQANAIAPSVDAWLVLARIDLGTNNLSASAQDVKAALQLDPKSGSALGMKAALANRGQTTP